MRRERQGSSEPVVDLAAVRRGRRHAELALRVARAQEENRRAFARLSHSGLLWTRRGAQAGKQLLANWQRLVEESDRIKRFASAGVVSDEIADALHAETEKLLGKSERLAERSAELVASGR